MQVQMSVTTKTIFILLAMVLTVTVVISAVLIRQSDSNIVYQQQEEQLKNQQRLQLFSEILQNRMVMWVDTFTQAELKNDTNLEQLGTALYETYEYLMLNFQVDDLYLFDNEGVVGREFHHVAPFIKSLVQTTQNTLESKTYVSCELQCRVYVSVPLMTTDEIVPVVVMSTSMQEVLSLFNRSTGIFKVAMVRYEISMQGRPMLSLASRLSPENRVYVTNLIDQLPKQWSADDLVRQGQRVTMDGESLLVSLLPFPHGQGDDPYVLVVRNISDLVSQKQEYELLVVTSAFALFIIFALLLSLFLNQYKNRLVAVSERLPILAEHKFKEFYALSARRTESTRFRLLDELDVVEQATNDLAKQLEDFDGQMAINTAKLEKMAMFDVLTGLPNRNMLTFQIEQQLARSARDDSYVALMFMDLDDFKKVNDSHGHDVGDKLLKAAAMRISKPIRETDIASRFGGDEFVILLSEIDSKAQVDIIARKIIAEFDQPIEVDNIQFYVSISVGVAITRHVRATPVELLRHADIAMYEAKAKKGTGYRVYDATMNLKVMQKVELEAEARVALRENQFSLALQPQVEFGSNKLIGFEALLRWYHPVRGHVSPADFIPLLESTSFMLELDYWVINKAMYLVQELNANGYPNMKVAINLSAGQFLDPGLPGFLKKQMDAHAVGPSQLCLELTENVLVSDITRATAVMLKVREMGCLLAIDDFGTGYSSLSYLKSLPADYIKIDRSFVSNITENADDRNIVHSTIGMVKNLNLQVVAEGVETIEQYDMLNEFGAELVQGYFISRPIPEAQIWSTLEEKVHAGYWQTPN